MLHAEKTVIPTQVIHSPKATNHKIPLLFGTSLYDHKIPQMPRPAIWRCGTVCTCSRPLPR